MSELQESSQDGVTPDIYLKTDPGMLFSEFAAYIPWPGLIIDVPVPIFHKNFGRVDHLKQLGAKKTAI